MVWGEELAARPRNERDVLRAAVDRLRQRTPPGWTLRTVDEEARGGRRRADAVLHLGSPEGDDAIFVVQAKTVLQARDVPAVQDQLTFCAQQVPGATGMVVARYLARSVRERLADAGLSYADASGNMLVRARRPGLYVADRGADHDPWRGPGRPRGTLKGEPAAKVVRALLDEAHPWRISDLVRCSNTSTGSVYRVLTYLESEALATRDSNGQVRVPDWAGLLRRWSQDYQFVRTNSPSRWIAPRGLDDLVARIHDAQEDQYAVTGTIAAAEYAPYAPARAAMIYVADAPRAADAWGLRRADSGVNVLLAEPAYPFILEERNLTHPRPVTGRPGGLRSVKPAQVAVDLMTGPGRSPAEAEELLNWMRSHEHSWRP